MAHFQSPWPRTRPRTSALRTVALVAGIASLAACSSNKPNTAATPKSDPRVGLKAGQFNAAEAKWNLNVVAEAKPSEKFVGSTNSDLAFTGKYAIQGNYNGFQVWDISTPSRPLAGHGQYERDDRSNDNSK